MRRLYLAVIALSVSACAPVVRVEQPNTTPPPVWSTESSAIIQIINDCPFPGDIYTPYYTSRITQVSANGSRTITLAPPSSSNDHQVTATFRSQAGSATAHFGIATYRRETSAYVWTLCGRRNARLTSSVSRG